MRIWKRGLIYLLFSILTLILFSGVSFGSLLPDGLIVENEFVPGYGLSVGRVDIIQGQVVIMHSDQMRGFWAKEGLPLFKGDALVTKEKSRIRFKLNDGSIMTMASNTKLIINRSIYNKKKKTRSSFLSLILGKARFIVTKMIAYRRSIFKVKSATAVVGVRGSDWIEHATETSTSVTALKDTKLEVRSDAAPEAPPTVVEEFEKTVVEKGARPSEVEHVSPEEAEKMIKKEFTVTPEGEAGTEAKVEKEKKGKKEGAAGEKKGGGEKASGGAGPVLVPVEEAAGSQETGTPEGETTLTESIEEHESVEQIDDAKEEQQKVNEQIQEDVVTQENSDGHIKITW